MFFVVSAGCNDDSDVKKKQHTKPKCLLPPFCFLFCCLCEAPLSSRNEKEKRVESKLEGTVEAAQMPSRISWQSKTIKEFQLDEC